MSETTHEKFEKNYQIIYLTDGKFNYAKIVKFENGNLKGLRFSNDPENIKIENIKDVNHFLNNTVEKENFDNCTFGTFNTVFALVKTLLGLNSKKY